MAASNELLERVRVNAQQLDEEWERVAKYEYLEEQKTSLEKGKTALQAQIDSIDEQLDNINIQQNLVDDAEENMNGLDNIRRDLELMVRDAN